MKKYLIDNNSDTLLLFFTGWGCDEHEFEHLKSESDVLILYDYTDLNLDFDFSKYKKFNLLAFSAGVFVASILDLNIEYTKKVAVSGNPFLFDENFGLSKKVQNLLLSITEDNINDFARNYLVKTDEEWQNFHNSQRTIESCQIEFAKLKRFYHSNKQRIKDIYNSAIIGEFDPLFDVYAQRGFYGRRLHIIRNARHNLFFKIKNYEQMLMC